MKIEIKKFELKESQIKDLLTLLKQRVESDEKNIETSGSPEKDFFKGRHHAHSGILKKLTRLLEFNQ